MDSKTNSIAENYTSLWNERDAAVRRRQIEEVWAPEATHFTPDREARGHDAIEARVTGAHEQFAGAGFVFRQAAPPDEHHDALRLRWEMAPAAGGEVAAAGTVFIVLDEDGRIRTDYQFTDIAVRQ